MVTVWDLDSKTVCRRLQDSKRLLRYAPDLQIMHRLVKRGPRNLGEGIPHRPV